MTAAVAGLDALDDRVVALLVEDARISTRAIALELGLPESTARARLKGLIDKGLVSPTVVVHPSVEDHQFLYVTRLTLRDGQPDVPDHPILREAPWVARATTEPLLFVQRAARTFDDLVAGVDALAEIDEVAGATHALFLRLFVGSNWAGQAPAPRGWTLSSERELDSVDRTLIQGLRRDGRASYTALAATVDLTVAATRKRVLRLVDAQAIRFITLVRPSVEDETAANLDLRVAPRDLADVIQRLCSLTSVRYVAEQTGTHNLACHVVASTTQDLMLAVGEVLADDRVVDHSVYPIETVRDELSWVPTPAR